MSKQINIVERTEARMVGLVGGETRRVTIREFHVDGARFCAIPDGATTAEWQAALDLCKAADFDYSAAAQRAADMDQRALCYSIIAGPAAIAGE